MTYKEIMEKSITDRILMAIEDVQREINADNVRDLGETMNDAANGFSRSYDEYMTLWRELEKHFGKC